MLNAMAIYAFRTVTCLSLSASALLAGREAALCLGWPEWLALAPCLVVLILCLPRKRHDPIIPNPPACDTPSSIAPEAYRGMHSAWKAGEDFLAQSPRSRELSVLPRFLSFGLDPAEGRKLLGTVALCPGGDRSGAGPAFTWHFARRAAWLDLDFALRHDDGGRWRLFLSQLEERRKAAPPAGIIHTLDARWLLAAERDTVQCVAATLRARLDDLSRLAGHALPAYLMVNRIDCLYGVRSLVSRLPADRLDQPLGAFRSGDGGDPGRFAGRALEQAIGWLAYRPDTAAGFQAGEELRRLAEPLALFCDRAFGDNAYQWPAHLGGVFFGSTGPSGTTLAPLLASLPSFRPEAEPARPATPWFWTDLLDNHLPADPAPRSPIAPRSQKRSVLANAGLAALSAGTLCLSWLITYAFLEARHVIGLAEGRIAAPGNAEDLPEYLELAESAEKRNAEWRLPRFGMNEAVKVEALLRRRYDEARNRLVGVPPAEGARAEPANPPGAAPAFIPARLDLDAPGADSAPVRAELRDYPGQSDSDIVQWLSEQINALPGGEEVDAAETWLPLAVPAGKARESRVRPAWTLRGYAMAGTMLDAALRDGVPGNAARRESVLSHYRREALRQWQAALRAAWSACSDQVRPAALPLLIRDMGRMDSPALRALALLDKHVTPMFPRGDRQPEIAWLRRYAGLLAQTGEDAHWRMLAKCSRDIANRSEAPSSGIELFRSAYRRNGAAFSEYAGDSLADARLAAARLDALVEQGAPAPDWDFLTFSAAHEQLRRLVLLRAARHLDDAWRDEVRLPYGLVPGTEEYRIAYLTSQGGFLEKFLTTTCLGFWRIDGQRFAAVRPDALPAMLSEDFVAFCNWALERGREPRPDKIAFAVTVHSLSVNARALEKPVGMELAWRDGGKTHTLPYRNFSQSGAFEWSMDARASLTVSIALPSITLTKACEGSRSVAMLLERIAGGKCVFTPDDFPERRDALERLGISDLTLRATVENADEFVRFAGETLREPPFGVTFAPADEPISPPRPDAAPPAVPAIDPGLFGNRQAFASIANR